MPCQWHAVVMDNLTFHGDDEAQKTETTALSHCYIALINTGIILTSLVCYYIVVCMPISSLKSASGLAPPPILPSSNVIIQTSHVRHIDGVVW